MRIKYLVSMSANISERTLLVDQTPIKNIQLCKVNRLLLTVCEFRSPYYIHIYYQPPSTRIPRVSADPFMVLHYIPTVLDALPIPQNLKCIQK